MKIQHEEQDSNAVIHLEGRVLLGPGCVQLEKLVTDLLSRGVLHLTFDLHAVTHIDSTGMGRFIDAYSKLKKAGGSVRIAGATGTVRDMFKITRLDSVFKFD